MWKKFNIKSYKNSKINYIKLAAFISFLVSFAWLLRAFFLGTYPDFQTQYYVPGLAFNGVSPFSGGGNLFTPQVYPPTAFFFFVIFTFVDYSLAPIIYTAVSIICLLGTLVLLSKIFSKDFFSSEFLFLSSLVFISFPVKFTLGMGQVNLILLFLISLSLFLFQKNKVFLSGLVLGIPIAVKFMPLLIPLYFLLKLKVRIILGLIISVFLFVLLTYLFIPHNIIFEFFKVFPSLLDSWKLDYYNQALSGFIGRSFGINDFSTLFKNTLSIALFIATFAILITQRVNNNSLIFGILITLNLIINTFSWQHHFVFLIIPFFAAYFEIKKKKKKSTYLLLLIASYFLVSANLKNPDVLPKIFLSHVFYGSLILYIIQIKLLLKEKLLNKVV